MNNNDSIYCKNNINFLFIHFTDNFYYKKNTSHTLYGSYQTLCLNVYYTPSDAATAFILSSACAFTASYSAGDDNVPRTST